MFYKIFVPKQAVGASLIYFDLFVPTGSPFRVRLMACEPVVSASVAVTGTLGVDLYLQRTSAVGTGGTAMTAEGASQSAMTAPCMNGTQPLNLIGLSGRLTPSGGATAGAVLGATSVFTEETTASLGVVPGMAKNHMPDVDGILIPPNSGFSVVQGTVASVGNIGFNVIVDVFSF